MISICLDMFHLLSHRISPGGAGAYEHTLWKEEPQIHRYLCFLKVVPRLLALVVLWEVMKYPVCISRPRGTHHLLDMMSAIVVSVGRVPTVAFVCFIGKCLSFFVGS